MLINASLWRGEELAFSAATAFKSWDCLSTCASGFRQGAPLEGLHFLPSFSVGPGQDEGDACGPLGHGI